MKIKIYNKDSEENCFINFLDMFSDNDKMAILSRILHITENHNWKPVPPTARPLAWFWDDELCEFRIALSKLLVRINYFLDKNDNVLVILNAYDKPNWASDKNSYNKKNLEKTKEKVNDFIKKAIEIKIIYTKDKNTNFVFLDEIF